MVQKHLKTKKKIDYKLSIWLYKKFKAPLMVSNNSLKEHLDAAVIPLALLSCRVEATNALLINICSLDPMMF